MTDAGIVTDSMSFPKTDEPSPITFTPSGITTFFADPVYPVSTPSVMVKSLISATVSSHEAETLFEAVAVMTAFPALTAVTLPFSSTVATFSSDDDHVSVLSDASLGRTDAVRVEVSPTPEFKSRGESDALDFLFL